MRSVSSFMPMMTWNGRGINDANDDNYSMYVVFTFESLFALDDKLELNPVLKMTMKNQNAASLSLENGKNLNYWSQHGGQ